ncbi:MAG TPA: toll/interleukin-1 receptor domain-containing protein [Pyrinomonadaceae bacterium]
MPPDETPDQTAAPGEFKYWAFISYSHRDEEWAQWLHKELETYRVPKRLVGRQTALGPVPPKLFPVFRDREELPGSADLGGNISGALLRSRTLVVVCSPRSAASRWVNEEIKTFKVLGREDRVLCLIVDGEPNATDRPELGQPECFPPALRFRVGADGALTEDRVEPIAADARKGKDGRENSKLKILAGLLGVGFDELRQREQQRRRRQAFQRAGAGVVILALLALTYAGLADFGVRLPGGESVRTFIDRHDISVMRPVRAEEEIRRSAVPQRRRLAEAIIGGRTDGDWIKATLKRVDKSQITVWSHSQALAALFRAPEARTEDLRPMLAPLAVPFTKNITVERNGVKYGWAAHGGGDREAMAEPALWTITALAAALQRPDLFTPEERRRYESWLAYAQEAADHFRPTDDGGWNMFADQIDPARHTSYTSVLALLALLELRKANLPWRGGVEARDRYLRATAAWLAANYDADAPIPGWYASGEGIDETADGLTLQIYAALLRAEDEAGFEIPPVILAGMTRHLARCAERPLSFPAASGEFTAQVRDPEGREFLAREAVSFLWHPWAIEASARWLRRAERAGAPPEDRVRVRRALDHLVVTLGEEATPKAASDWTFVCAETLYCLSAVAQP